MPTLSAMGMRMPSLTQRHNYAWQQSHSEKQTGPNTIPSSRVFQGLPDPTKQLQGGREVQCLQIILLNFEYCAA